jgi:hypothetical protein
MFKSIDKTALQEIGPRFTLKLRWLRKGLPAVTSGGSVAVDPSKLVDDAEDAESDGEEEEGQLEESAKDKPTKGKGKEKASAGGNDEDDEEEEEGDEEEEDDDDDDEEGGDEDGKGKDGERVIPPLNKQGEFEWKWKVRLRLPRFPFYPPDRSWFPIFEVLTMPRPPFVSCSRSSRCPGVLSSSRLPDLPFALCLYRLRPSPSSLSSLGPCHRHLPSSILHSLRCVALTFRLISPVACTLSSTLMRASALSPVCLSGLLYTKPNQRERSR